MNKLFLHQPLVVYYEQQYHPLMNRVMQSGCGGLQELLQHSGYTLIYFPGLWKPAGYNDPAITRHFRYFLPEYHQLGPEHLSNARRMLSIPHLLQVLYKGLKEMLGKKSYPKAGFITISNTGHVSIVDFAAVAEKALKSPLPEQLLMEEILAYFSEYEGDLAASISPDYEETSDLMSAQEPVKAVNRLESYIPDPEKEFEAENLKVNRDVLQDLQSALAGEEGPVVLDLLIRIMEHIRIKDPRLVTKLEQMLQLQLKPKEKTLSPLQLILTHGGYDYKILLPEYDVVVDMPQLPKALYLFFLRHPEGVFLHDLPDYRDELNSIYARIANISDMRTITANIDRLVDMTDNSIHVNCARIKRAFLEKISDRYACYYYVTGTRGKAKKVNLPHELISIDENLP
ncbi:MAG: hypothetical protein AB9842_04995 [Bacteroidales bacterium]